MKTISCQICYGYGMEIVIVKLHCIKLKTATVYMTKGQAGVHILYHYLYYVTEQWIQDNWKLKTFGNR